MMKNLVSVIIPYFNRKKVVISTIQSVINQDYRPIELILVDDCSSDPIDDKTLISLNADINIRHIRNEINTGPGGARQKGRKIANGEYVTYLDSDDSWHPQFLNKLVSILEKNETISMAFSNILIHEKDKIKTRLSIPEGKYSIFDLIFSGHYWATGAAVWRATFSTSDNWIYTRDHEDYVHDISSSLMNPDIYFTNESLCYVNKLADQRIERSNTEFIQSIQYLNNHIKNNINCSTTFISKYIDFILLRMRKRPPTIRLIMIYFSTLRQLFPLYFKLEPHEKKQKLIAIFKLIAFWAKYLFAK